MSKYVRIWYESGPSVSLPVNLGGPLDKLASTSTSTQRPARPPVLPNTFNCQKRNSSTPGWVYHASNTKLSTEHVKTLTVGHDDLRLKAPAHPHNVSTETRVEMSDVQLCTTRNTDKNRY